MKENFTFQVEAFSTIGKSFIEVEGRCCEGNVQQGDIFTEILIRTKRDNGSFDIVEARLVFISVKKVTSIRPGFLGIGESGTLKIEGVEAINLERDCLLKGTRSI